MARPKKTLEQLAYQYRDILDALAIGLSQREIARGYGVSLSTVERLKKRFF